MGKCSFPGHTLERKKAIYFQSDTGETRPKTESARAKTANYWRRGGDLFRDDTVD
jgi:hypothetical protein